MSLTPSLANNKKTKRESCRLCALSSLCLPSALDEKMIIDLETFISSGKPYLPKENIYLQGEAFKALYVVKSGAAKTYLTNANGHEHITGFYLPGEIFGLESIAGRQYLSSAKALSDTRLCKVNYQQLATLRKNNSSLTDWAINLFSQSLASGHDFFNCLSQHTALSRLATFILAISLRTSRTSTQQLVFSLPMSRQDIGNYLGLAPETTSRAFSKLVEQGCLKKRNKDIEIIDQPKLTEFSLLSSSN